MTQSAAVEDRSPEEEGNRRNRIFWRFWTGSTISGAVTAVTMPLLAVLVLHASSFQVGGLAAATDAAWLLIGLPAGVIFERFPLRETRVVMDVVRAVALASVPVAYLMHGLSFIQLVLVALISGFASVVFDVGNSTFIVSVVSKDELAKRNSLSSGSDAFVQLGGPSLGGVLVQLVGGPVCLLIDSISYCASAILLWSLPRPQREAAGSRSVSSALAMIRDGWWYTARHKVIGPCMAAAALVNFTCGALMALIPIYLVRTLHVNAALVGALLAAGCRQPHRRGCRGGPGVAPRERSGRPRGISSIGCCHIPPPPDGDVMGPYPVRHWQRWIRLRGYRAEHPDKDLPPVGDAAGDPATRHGHRTVRVVGGHSGRVTPRGPAGLADEQPGCAAGRMHPGGANSGSPMVGARWPAAGLGRVTGRTPAQTPPYVQHERSYGRHCASGRPTRAHTPGRPTPGAALQAMRDSRVHRAMREHLGLSSA